MMGKFWQTLKGLPRKIITMIKTRPRRIRATSRPTTATAKKKGSRKFPWWILFILGLAALLWHFQPGSPVQPSGAAAGLSLLWIPAIVLLVPTTLLAITAGVVFFLRRKKLPSLKLGKVGGNWPHITAFATAIGMVIAGVWVAFPELFPTLWGVVEEHAGERYVIAGVLLVAGIGWLYWLTKPAKTPAAQQALAAKAEPTKKGGLTLFQVLCILGAGFVFWNFWLTSPGSDCGDYHFKLDQNGNKVDWSIECSASGIEVSSEVQQLYSRNFVSLHITYKLEPPALDGLRLQARRSLKLFSPEPAVVYHRITIPYGLKAKLNATTENGTPIKWRVAPKTWEQLPTDPKKYPILLKAGEYAFRVVVGTKNLDEGKFLSLDVISGH